MSKLKESDNRRVVVTGLGVISSLGIGWQDFWKNLIAGKSGISRIETFDTSKYDRHYAGEVKNFDPTKFMSKRRASQIGRASQMAIAAAKLAVKDAGVKISELRKHNPAVCLGTTMGEAQVIEQIVKHTLVNHEEIKPKRALIYPASSISINVGEYFGFKGPSNLFSTACAAGNYAIAYGCDLIRAGRCEYAVAGGVDALSRIAFTGFGRLFAMAPEKCQPFDKNRRGMLLGEGAGVVLLESAKNAYKRKAHIYAEVLGYGLSCDAHHMTEPSVPGVVSAIKKAIQSSKIDISEVDYVSAHGTGTKENDKAECAALRIVFDDRTSEIPISSIKSMLGHSMGAASAIEAMSCCLAIDQETIPPTINFSEKDPDCDIDCVPNICRKHKIRVAVNNSQAFGGNNACVVIRGYVKNEQKSL